MASIRAVAIKKANAVERLDDLTRVIAEQHHIEFPPFKATNKDPQLAQAQRLDWMADVLELIAAAFVSPDFVPPPEVPAEKRKVKSGKQKA